jgi:hypothetical protein
MYKTPIYLLFYIFCRLRFNSSAYFSTRRNTPPDIFCLTKSCISRVLFSSARTKTGVQVHHFPRRRKKDPCIALPRATRGKPNSHHPSMASLPPVAILGGCPTAGSIYPLSTLSFSIWWSSLPNVSKVAVKTWLSRLLARFVQGQRLGLDRQFIVDARLVFGGGGSRLWALVEIFLNKGLIRQCTWQDYFIGKAWLSSSTRSSRLQLISSHGFQRWRPWPPMDLPSRCHFGWLHPICHGIFCYDYRGAKNDE